MCHTIPTLVRDPTRGGMNIFYCVCRTRLLAARLEIYSEAKGHGLNLLKNRKIKENKEKKAKESKKKRKIKGKK